VPQNIQNGTWKGLTKLKLIPKKNALPEKSTFSIVGLGALKN